MLNKRTIALVIPALNEEKALGSVIDAIPSFVDHIIVIDDGSTDNTVEVARQKGAKVFSHKTNRGVGAAMGTGVRTVLETHGHWDHFGVSPDESLEDRIYNGGLDNATGTSALLELARAFKSLDSAPARSVVFMPVTAEEQGLLGSEYYASNPVFPTSQTVAAINIDGLNIHGSMRDLVVVGYGASELDAVLEEWASSVGRVLRPDPEAEKGFYYRSDHFNFAKEGVPVEMAALSPLTSPNASTRSRRTPLALKDNGATLAISSR